MAFERMQASRGRKLQRQRTQGPLRRTPPSNRRPPRCSPGAPASVSATPAAGSLSSLTGDASTSRSGRTLLEQLQAAAPEASSAPSRAVDPNLDDDEADGDSDVEGEEVGVFIAGLADRLAEADSPQVDEDDDGNFVTELAKLQVGDRVMYDRRKTNLPGIHKVPENFRPKMYSSTPKPGAKEKPGAKTKKSAVPNFEDVDNPGDWDQYCFKPVNIGGTYSHHKLPTGASVVPRNEAGHRVHNGFDVYYEGEYSRQGTDNLLPPINDSKSSLDADVLKKHGITPENRHDPLLIWDLLLPIVDPKNSGVPGDDRKPYYTEVSYWSGKYQWQKRFANNPYGHYALPVEHIEHVHWDGIILYDGCMGSSDGDIHSRYVQDTPQYSPVIADTMPFERFKQIKRCRKLCDEDKHPKRGEEGYDPAYKFDYLYECMTYNINRMTKRANVRQTVDEFTWAFGGKGPAGDQLINSYRNKKCGKGGQTVLCMDRDRVRCHAYVHRHNKHPLEPGITRQGSQELLLLTEQLERMVATEFDDLPDRQPSQTKYCEKKIFDINCPPAYTTDNFFYSDPLVERLGRKGWAWNSTIPLDRLPGESKYFHHVKLKGKGPLTAKITKWYEPVVFVKYHPEVPEAQGTPENPAGKAFWQHAVSMCSTSSCNWGGCNYFDQIFAFAVMKERGRGEHKFQWPVEMNHCRLNYLDGYGRVDVCDHYIRNCHLHLRSYKYWHAAMVQGYALAEAQGYDIYKELCEGTLEGFSKCTPRSFKDWRSRLATSLCNYHPSNGILNGDRKLREATILPMEYRAMSPTASSNKKKRKRAEIVSRAAYLEELGSQPKCKKKARFCDGDMFALGAHICSKLSLANPKNCAVCNQAVYTACGICKDSKGKEVALHYPNSRSNNCPLEGQCCVIYHSKYWFGLCHDDMPKRGYALKDWKKPTQAIIRANKKAIQQYDAGLDDIELDDDAIEVSTATGSADISENNGSTGTGSSRGGNTNNSIINGLKQEVPDGANAVRF
jgi:hypothetical protein